MANIVTPQISSASSLLLSLPPSSSSSSSLSLFHSKLRPRRNPNHVFPSESQAHCVALPKPFSPNEEPFFTSEFSHDCSSLTSFVDYNFVDLFEALRVSVRLGDVDLAEAVHASVAKLGECALFGNALLSAYLKLGFLCQAHKIFLGLSRPDLTAFAAMISGFSKSSREDEAIELFMEMRRRGIEPNEYGFVAILTACIRVLDADLGLQVHALAIKTGYLSCVFVANSLVNLYGKSGRFEYAGKLFDEMPKRDLSSWNSFLSSATNERLYGKAFELFRSMREIDSEVGINEITISTILSACGQRWDSDRGKEVHALAIKCGLDEDLKVGNALIRFYSACGSIEDVTALFEKMPVIDLITWTEMITAYMGFGLTDSALEIFENMPKRNSYSYNSILAGLCKNGQGFKALVFFTAMISERLELTDYTLTSVANASGLLGDAKVAEQVHGFIVKSGCESNDFVESALLDMYARCGKMFNANKMFERWPIHRSKSVVLTSMICGYARIGKLKTAISLFHGGQSDGRMVLDEVSAASILSVCASTAFLELGKQIHGLSIKLGFSTDLQLGNAILGMYGKCWTIEEAIKAFNSMPNRDVVSWNSLIAAHLLHRKGDDALLVWSEMQKTGSKPDELTSSLVISAYRYTSSNLVQDCRNLFHSLNPSSDQTAAFVSVLGFWGFLEEAEEVIHGSRSESDVSAWRALLDSCRIRQNTRVGKRAEKQILATEARDVSTQVLVSNLHSASGRWRISESLRRGMREKGLRKRPGQSWIVLGNEIHSFFARDNSHDQSKDIRSGLQILIRECRKVGYVPDPSFVLHEVEEHQKEDFLFHHSVKLATAYGVLMTGAGKPIRVVKNITVCGDCHAFLKCVSIVTHREIYLRDSSGFHCFSRGHCSCKDYW